MSYPVNINPFNFNTVYQSGKPQELVHFPLTQIADKVFKEAPPFCDGDSSAFQSFESQKIPRMRWELDWDHKLLKAARTIIEKNPYLKRAGKKIWIMLRKQHVPVERPEQCMSRLRNLGQGISKLKEEEKRRRKANFLKEKKIENNKQRIIIANEDSQLMETRYPPFQQSSQKIDQMKVSSLLN